MNPDERLAHNRHTRRVQRQTNKLQEAIDTLLQSNLVMLLRHVQDPDHPDKTVHQLVIDTIDVHSGKSTRATLILNGEAYLRHSASQLQPTPPLIKARMVQDDA